MKINKKLIEVALPLEAINKEALRRKQKAPKGWPTSFHKWWAQRPLAAARAVVFAQMVDDPSAYPDLFPTQKKQEKERQRLFKLIEEIILWDNTSDEKIVQRARDAIWESWRRTCAENADHPKASELFNRDVLPRFLDPFAGSGSIPLSAQWLGISSYATDLNPVAVLINKAIIEIPHKFAGRPPVNPAWQKVHADAKVMKQWEGAQGLADDVRHYGQWMRDEAHKRIGHLYPKIVITDAMGKELPILKLQVGQQLTVIAWLWARTVHSPNPAFRHVEVPLASTYVLSSKAGKEAYVVPIVEGDRYRFTVKVGKPPDNAKSGTKLPRANFSCLLSDAPISGDYIKAEGKAGRMGARLMAIVTEGPQGRVYLAPTSEQEAAAQLAKPTWKPDGIIPTRMTGGNCTPYGMTTWGDLYTSRQLAALTTFSDLVGEAIEKVKIDAIAAGIANTSQSLDSGGTEAQAYAEAIAVYLACVVDRMAYYGTSLTTWLPKDNALRDCMPRQALAMTWDYAEGNPLGKSSGDVSTCSKAVANYLDVACTNTPGLAMQSDAQTGLQRVSGLVISTDPPYYDNIGYADLSDFFYIWLRRTLKGVFPSLFTTVAAPKAEELVATPSRHGGKENAEIFFLNGMTQAMHRLALQGHPAYPVTIYYAFKQSESNSETGTTNTGWDTFLAAVIKAGFEITGTWPMRTEGEGRMIASGTNVTCVRNLLPFKQ